MEDKRVGNHPSVGEANQDVRTYPLFIVKQCGETPLFDDTFYNQNLKHNLLFLLCTFNRTKNHFHTFDIIMTICFC